MNITDASRQWAIRPFDERYESISDMKEKALHQFENSYEVGASLKDIEVVPTDLDIGIRRKSNGKAPASMSNWSFNQLCTITGSPARFLRTLKPEMAADILNYRFSIIPDNDSTLLLNNNGTYNVRSLTSTKYGRIWDYKLCDALERIEESGWRVPPARPVAEDQPGTRAATADDVLINSSNPEMGIKEGDLIAPAGLYRGDRDLFAFMVDDDHRIDDGSDGGLYRGIIVRNSEVGAAYFELMTFLYRSVCGNHIVWSAENVNSFRIKHVGNAEERLAQFMMHDAKKYLCSSSCPEEQKIMKSRTTMIEKDKDKVIDKLFSMKLATRQILENAFNAVIPDEDGSPRSVYGFIQGMTRMSQQTGYTDKRFLIDRAAGQIMKLV